MRIAVDLDGVLYEWSKTARWMLRNIRGCTDPALRWESEYWSYIPDHVSKEDWSWLWSEGVRLGLFRHGHVTTGGMEGVKALKAAGHTLVVATHRPPDALRDTLSWLDHNFGSAEPYPWSGIYYLSNEEPKTIVDAHILIDDKPENVAQWTEAGRVACLFARPWNRGLHKSYTRVAGWDGVVKWICT